MKTNKTETKKGECYRSYRLLNLSPSATTNLTVSISLSPDYKMDIPFVVFYLASLTTGDFIQLEIIQGKARFTWNLGNGQAHVEHSNRLKINNKENSDNIWYKITVKR